VRDLRAVPPEQLTQELQQLIAAVLDRTADEVPVDERLVEGLGIDSVMLMQVLMVLRRTYQVEFEDADLARMQPATVRDIRDLLLEKASAGAG
jgi:acyl carrier protein